MAVRNFARQPLAATPAQPRHVGRSPGLIDEDELARIKPRLLLLPGRACHADVGAILFGGVQTFFEGDVAAVAEPPHRTGADEDATCAQPGADFFHVRSGSAAICSSSRSL